MIWTFASRGSLQFILVDPLHFQAIPSSFFKDIIIQPDCKMLFLLCFQSVNCYTSMLLSFLGVFEIHSVDWFGLVFVLPLLKNKNTKFFSGCEPLQVCDQTWLFHPLFEDHLYCFHNIGSCPQKGRAHAAPSLALQQWVKISNCYEATRPPSLTALLPGTELTWPVSVHLFIYSVHIQPHLLIQGGLFRDGCGHHLTRLVGGWALPLSGGGHMGKRSTQAPKAMSNMLRVETTHPSGGHHNPAHVHPGAATP